MRLVRVAITFGWIFFLTLLIIFLTKLVIWPPIKKRAEERAAIKKKIEELERRKKRLEKMREIATKRFYAREISESDLKEMIREYSNQLIEIEAEMRELRAK
jgi:hypothetical protein